jgi:hypothetical protein
MKSEQMKEPVDILGDDFARAAAEAALHARIDALTAGKVVVSIDELDRYIKQRPDGRRFEVRLQPETSRDSHICVLREWLGQEHGDFVHPVRGERQSDRSRRAGAKH